jgi:hypothetical protein
MKPPKRLFPRREPIPDILDLQATDDEIARLREGLIHSAASEEKFEKFLRALPIEGHAVLCLLLLARARGLTVIRTGRQIIDLTGRGRGDWSFFEAALPERLRRIGEEGRS